jgi:hypothetical protein
VRVEYWLNPSGEAKCELAVTPNYLQASGLGADIASGSIFDPQRSSAHFGFDAVWIWKRFFEGTPPRGSEGSDRGNQFQ